MLIKAFIVWYNFVKRAPVWRRERPRWKGFYRRYTMSFPWYVITGEINVDNFTNLRTFERGFIWRGFTRDCEMKTSAANYDQFSVVSCLPMTGKGIVTPRPKFKELRKKYMT
jgi:hypothetical protein